MKSCVAVGEAWIRITKVSIDLFSILRNVNAFPNDSDITEQIKCILVAIKNASEVCVRLRLADIQAI